jgi:diguanylate cyclase (GGDEF)-like protein
MDHRPYAPAASSASARAARLRATTRALTYRYALALALIGSLAVTGFFILQHTIATHDASSSIISQTSQQSDLVLEVVSTARYLVESDDATVRATERATLFEAARAIEKAHRKLTDPVGPLGRPLRTSPPVRELYLAPPLELDRKIRTFLADAYAVSGTIDGGLDGATPALQGLLTSANPIRMSLSVLVDQLEADARQSVRTSRLVEGALLATTLLMLSLEALFIFRPIVQRVRLEGAQLIESQDKLFELANYDPLTGLPNRALFQLRLEMALAQARRDSTLTAVLQLDLDHFKDVNDTLGHAAGDHLLAQIAQRLLQRVRATDTVARLGGDEFALILADLDTASDAALIAIDILHALGQPVMWQQHEIHSCASIGITLYPTDDTEPAQLLANADIALYQAKAAGRGGFAFFIGEMKDRLERRVRIEAELRHALSADQLELFYQPQVRLRDGAVVAVEALLRWHHPERGLLLPGAFVGVAEESRLILPLGLMALRKALQQMALWQARGIVPLRIAVNVASAQLRADGFAEEVEAALIESGVDPCSLELEITENVMLGRGNEKVTEKLDRLRRRGVNVALDDFGTGYASLSDLKRTRVDRLKVDRSFVRDIGRDADDEAIVRAIINLGNALGHEVVAEGVENEQQLAFLRQEGCGLAQGFRFGRPMPARDLELLLRHSPMPQQDGVAGRVTLGAA